MTAKEQQEKNPEAIKNSGNRLFAAGEYELAMKCYSRAIELLLGDDDRKLKAVCLSNRSNALFELGKYQDCIDDATACLELLTDETEKTLRYKNMLRLARAWLYLGSFDNCRQVLDKLGASCCCDDTDNGSEAYKKRADRMLKQLEYYGKLETDNNKTTMTPPMIRASLLDPVREYYRFGHDAVVSALDGTDTKPELDIEKTPNLSLLFAGINDGRHVIATIMHLFLKYRATMSSKQVGKHQFHARCMCNDVNNACMARFVVIFMILHKIGSSTRHFADLKTNDKAARWCALLQYIYLGYAMPPWANEMLVEVMLEALSIETRDAFVAEYPWLACSSDKDWVQAQRILSYWVDQASGGDGSGQTTHKKHDPKWKDIPGVRESLDDCFVLRDPDFQEHIANLPSHSREFLEAQRKENAAAQKAMVKEKYSDLSKVPPQAVALVREKLGGKGVSDQEIVQFFHRAIDEEPDEEYDHSEMMKRTRLQFPGIALATEFLSGTKALLPPKGLCDDPIFDQVYKSDAEVSDTWREPEEKVIDPLLIHKARQVIEDTWTTNPMMYDPLYISIGDTEHDFDPIDEFLNDFAAEGYLAEDLDKDSIVAALDGNGTSSVTEFFDWTSIFFWNGANALVRLIEADALSIEWNVGDIISVSHSLRENRNCSFHRIQASNIPDYTGMLAFFTEVVPLLHESTKDVSTSLEVNILLNCPLWRNYAQYIFSSTAIPNLERVETTLGMKFLGDKDVDTWAHGLAWTWSKALVRNASSKEEFCLWLQRLYLSIILPPERDYKAINRENLPYTICMFLRVCDFCVQWLHYPAHWVSSVLDELLALSDRKQLKTKAQLRSASPSIYKVEQEWHLVNLSAFLLDLRTQIAIHFQQRKETWSMIPLTTSLLPQTAIKVYEVCFDLDIESSWHQQEQDGLYGSQCLALVLEPTKPTPDDEDSFDGMMQMMQMMMSRFLPKKGIRNEILSEGSKQFEVLSCMESIIKFGEKKNRVRFYMSEADFVARRNSYVSILRTDGWFRVRNPVRLDKAVEVAASN